MFGAVLIANRGEIACRIARTCRHLGIVSIGVYSDADKDSLHVKACDEAVHLPGVASTDTYLKVEALLEAVVRTGADALHPGYGFLAENADFAAAVDEAGISFVGPPARAMRAVGDKIAARNLAVSAGVPVVPGLLQAVEDLDLAREFGAQHGYPLAIKASGGGGGRGLKVARAADQLDEAFASARREAEAYFGSREVYVERYLTAPKHLEVQILAPNPDEALWLGVRDCSLQRRHQKLIEETPPPRFAERAVDMGEAAVTLSKACGYVNAGTVELLVDETGDFYFLEVNSRLQVEHTVTEEVFGIDLVECQLRIAAGDPLGFTQADLSSAGHAIECRINAEDPARGFAPSPGLLRRYVEPAGRGVRVDSGYSEGDLIPQAYDSLVAKLITWGEDRAAARALMLSALDEFVIEGVATTIPAQEALLNEESFVAGLHTTRTVEESGVLERLIDETAEPPGEQRDVLLVDDQAIRLWNPAMAASAAAAVHGAGGSGEVTAPMQGTILKVLVAEGAEVKAGEPLVVLEAMKMETEIAAPKDGTVVELGVRPGQTTGAGQLIAKIE